MAEQTAIEWTSWIDRDGTRRRGHTFNPWMGCTKVSPACDHCYAERFGARQHVTWGKGEARRRTTNDNWQKPLTWDRYAQENGVRPKVFCASLADVFDTEVPEAWRHDLFRLIDQTPHLDWLVLTKRSKPAMTRLTDPDWWRDAIGRVPDGLQLPQIWYGNTVENQEMMNMRWRWMRQTPAAVKFLSMEPLLSHVDLPADFLALGKRAWVITGGETGSGARLSLPEWYLHLLGQSISAGVPHHFKQYGDWLPIRPFAGRGDVADGAVNESGRISLTLTDGGQLKGDLGQTAFAVGNEGGHVFARVGKHAAGRLLGGRTWDEEPVGPLSRPVGGRLL